MKISHVHLNKALRYLVTILTLTTALLYLKTDFAGTMKIASNILEVSLDYLPDMLLLILLIILGVTLANLITFGLRRFFDATGLSDLMMEQNKEHVLSISLVSVRIALYLLISVSLMSIFGMDVHNIVRFLGWALYGLLGLLLLYVFFGTRAFVENFIAGIYLKSSRILKLGHKVKVDGTEGTVKSISNQGITIKSDFGYNTFIPNREFIKKEVSYRHIETDLDTLEKIKGYFVEQKPSYCGPACASMILKIFGFNATQAEIGDKCGTEVGKGTHPKKLIEVVHEITRGKVGGAWIDVDHITELKSEMRLWLSQGALPIIDYKKNMLFPAAKSAHYSVVVSIEGDDLVILDPSGKKGGVYLADPVKIYRGMDTFSELIQGKRGYIVFAPEGTTAFHRIEEGIIYSDPGLYTELSQQLKKELFSILEKGQVIESVLPPRVKSFLSKWKEKDKIARLWRPNTI